MKEQAMEKGRRPSGRVFEKCVSFTAGSVLAFCVLLAFAGCRNTLIPSHGYVENQQNPDGAKPGTVRLEVLSGKQARTLMPDLGENGGPLWAIIDLHFERTDGGAPRDYTYEYGDEMRVDLDAGWWTLEAEAKNESEKTVARYNSPEFEVGPGETTEIEVFLVPLTDGGPVTFRIEIADADTVDSAAIAVTTWPGGSDILPGDSMGYDQDSNTMDWSGDIDPGQYMAKLTLVYGDGEVVLSKMLHIYSNLESLWEEDARNIHAGKTIFDAWDGEKWDFESTGITVWHLKHFDSLYEYDDTQDDLYDGFAEGGILSGMEIGEIDRLFTELSNSASDTKPDAGGYDYARFANLIDAALVERAFSQMPDDLGSRKDVEALFKNLLKNDGNDSKIEFGWDTDFTLCIYVGLPRYKVKTTKTPVITVTLNPDKIENMERGGVPQNFTATVTGLDWPGVPQDVEWTLSGAQNNGTTINGGQLSIAPDEPTSALTVRATSKIGTDKHGEATVTIKPTVKDITVSGSGSVSRGDNSVFTATVGGYGNPPQDVIWDVFSSDRGTIIFGDGTLSPGTLHVAGTDKNVSITVRATSTEDTAVYGEMNVMLTGTVQDGEWNMIAVGTDHTMGIKHDGTLWTWGRNSHGQLGLGDEGDGTSGTPDNNRNKPVQVGSDTDWLSVGGGWAYTVALKEDGTLWAWGTLYKTPGNSNEVTKKYGSSPRQIEVPPGLKKVIDIGVGYKCAFVIDEDGRLWGWGSNVDGILGTGNDKEDFYETPVQIGSDTDWKFASSGRKNSLAIKTDGSLYVWGEGDSNEPLLLEVRDESGSVVRWRSGTYGDGFAIAIDNDNNLWTWGDNKDGALGIPSSNGEPTKMTGVGSGKWISVANDASSHVVAIDSDGKLFAWGKNNFGQIGDGNGADNPNGNEKQETPVQILVPGVNRWRTSMASGSFSFAISEKDGSLWGWGHNAYGQLGVGDIINKKTPVLVPKS